ncbi:hypothetical protein ACTFIZ_012878 [Dictyostelium cf. discoideum]
MFEFFCDKLTVAADSLAKATIGNSSAARVCRSNRLLTDCTVIRFSLSAMLTSPGSARKISSNLRAATVVAISPVLMLAFTSVCAHLSASCCVAINKQAQSELTNKNYPNYFAYISRIISNFSAPYIITPSALRSYKNEPNDYTFVQANIERRIIRCT